MKDTSDFVRVRVESKEHRDFVAIQALETIKQYCRDNMDCQNCIFRVGDECGVENIHTLKHKDIDGFKLAYVNKYIFESR